MVLKIAPLHGTFMLASIIGFIVSALYIYDWSKTWGFTFALVFVLMFIASIISMTYASVDSQLQIDEVRKKKKTY